MDLNGNKCSDKEEDDFTEDSNTGNVRSLKLFFQNQPIIGVKPLESNNWEESKGFSVDSSEDNPYFTCNTNHRNYRMIPRPPKPIQSCDIKVSPFLRSLVSIQCERTNSFVGPNPPIPPIPPNLSNPPIPPIPPIPLPRKSLQKHKSVEYSDSERCFRSNDELKTISDSGFRPNSLIESLTKEFKELNSNERNPKSSHILPKTDEIVICQTYEPKGEALSQKSVPNIANDSTVKQNTNKSKTAFKSFLKRSKLLSIRRISAQNSEKQRMKKMKSSDANFNANQKPIKPTRKPPEPPKLKFRPPAPLPPPEPNEDYYEDTLPTLPRTAPPQIDNRLHNGYELYNDSVDESEGIYCSLDNEDYDSNHSDIYEGIDDYDDGLTHRSDQTYICDNYYEDNTIDDFSDCEEERIYEVLPFERDSDSNESNGSTISLDDNLSETNNEIKTQQIAENEQKFDSFSRKRNLKAIKLKKKFNLNGDEIPVNAGTVKEDHRGNRYDLFVRKGETVLILRMEGNPPGKWLAKNERSKVGFVDLDNISFDAESVKCIIKSLSSKDCN